MDKKLPVIDLRCDHCGELKGQFTTKIDKTPFFGNVKKLCNFCSDEFNNGRLNPPPVGERD
jgi:C4-type Zn-finger protein